MNQWARLVGSGIGTLMLLAVAVRAAGAVGGERDKQTLDTLLTTPLTENAILYGKWIGCVFSVRGAWLWLAAIYALAAACGGVYPFAFPLVAAAWFVYAGAIACAGLYFSVTCRTTLRATVSTLLAVVAFGGGHWLVSSLLCYMPLSIMGVPERNFEWLLAGQFGQTPSAVLYLLAFYRDDFGPPWGGGMDDMKIRLVVGSVLGLITWTVGALVLWQVTLARFRKVYGRAPIRRRKAPFSPAPHAPAPAPRRPEREPEVLEAILADPLDDGKA